MTFSQRDFATGQVVRKLNALGTGGGGGGITVLDYDATDPANYVSENITLADFEAVNGSALIDTVNNQFKADVAQSAYINAPYNISTEYAAIKLGTIPQSGSVTVDYSHYADYALALIFKDNTNTIQNVVEKHLIQNWTMDSIPRNLGILYNNSGDDHYNPPYEGLLSKTRYKLESGSNDSSNDVYDLAVYGTAPITLQFGSGLNVLMQGLGVTTEAEVIDTLLTMGMSIEDIQQILLNYKSFSVLFYDDILVKIPPSSTEMYVVLMPKINEAAYDLQDTTVDPAWAVSISMNAQHISKWNVPANCPDGTYLKISGNCQLLGHNCKTGDYLQVYANGTQGILIKG
ncbi:MULTISPECIES: hypothetical protein [Acinetobacter]|uniref:Uncharacterized protein n=1 Tax=Acinetobacter corruptisaponis TaxID=3045147 RepID=A0ABY8S0I1_9GAMM|nr:hypothetical protein [Acinetobacter sp. KCTC 92772]WHP04776.1 hypothetical protein QLH32_12005 [Acinetobacter sp. KCTC 92772]